MKTIQLDQRTIEEQRQAFLADLRSVQPSSSAGALGMPGIETILLWIAEKIVLSMFMAFVNREMYDKYKGMQSAAQVAEAHSEIITLGLNANPAIPPQTLRTDLIATLTAEGIPKAQAEVVVDKMLARADSTLGVHFKS